MWQTKSACVDQGFSFPPDARFGYVALATFRTDRSDLDNIFKVVQDAVFGGLGVDDKRILSIQAGKLVNPRDPHVKIVVSLLNTADVANLYGQLLT